MQQDHRIGRVGWLRAAILGADDGIVSTTSLMVGIGAASASTKSVLVGGIAGLVAGAMSMAAGEYVSVSSQQDLEEADIALERRHLRDRPADELQELTDIYVRRGLDPKLARDVAEQLSVRDELQAHLRDELGLTEVSRARPFQAAISSGVSFATAAILPIVSFILLPEPWRSLGVPAISLCGLGALGGVGASVGGAPPLRAAARVLLGGGLAMLISALVGKVIGRSNAVL
jgi:vacuolar iron transporter family protein